MKRDDSADFTVILRTGKPYEIEMAANALREHGIPFYRQSGSTGGIIEAMPMTPVPGPGVRWSILVSKVAFEDAMQVLLELPMEIKGYPDLWDFGLGEKTKRGWTVYAIVMLLMSAVALLSQLSAVFD